MAALARAAADAEQWLRDLGSALGAEQRRLLADLEARRVEFVAEARRVTGPALERRLAAITTRWGPRLRREAMRAALEIARAKVPPWLGEQQAVAEAAFAERTERFRQLALALTARIAAMGVPEFAAFAVDVDDHGSPERASFQFQPLLHVARPASPIRYVADVGLAVAGGRDLIRASARRFLDWLLELNSSRVQAGVTARLDASRGMLEGALRTRLRTIEAGARRAIDRAVELRAAGAENVSAELGRLEELERELRPIAQAPGEAAVDAVEQHR